MKMTAKTRAIDKVFKRRDRYQIPSWQRGKVWTKPKQQMLIDTILRGWKIPKFSANKGHDLFKITTKVLKTLNGTSEVAQDSTRFSELLSGLYFVFKESIGKKLDKLPQSFQDVNDMRIGLQHDLDQEGPSAAAKKKLQHGAVFVKYIGVSSPAVASGSRFAIGQLKLMSSLRDDLFILIENEN